MKSLLLRFGIMVLVVAGTIVGGGTSGLAGVPGSCLSDAALAFWGSSVTGCTAKEGAVSNIDLIDVVDGCVSSSDTAVVSMTIGLEDQNANKRYNAGIFINRDGGSALSDTGMTSFGEAGKCFHEALFPIVASGDPVDAYGNPIIVLDSGYGPFSNHNGDACGDASSGQQITRTLVGSSSSTDFTANTPALIRIKCSDVGSYDLNGNWVDGQMNGSVDINACVSYQQKEPKADKECDDITKAVADTTSKCSCRWVDTSSLNLTLSVPELQVTIGCDAYVAPGEPYTCTVGYSNVSTNAAADYIEFHIPYPVDQVSVVDTSFALGAGNPDDSIRVDSVNNVIVLTPRGDVAGNNGVPTDDNVTAGGSGTFTFQLQHIDGSAGSDITNRIEVYYNNTGDTAYDGSSSVYQNIYAEANTNVTAALLSSFSATLVEDGVLVEWETEVENATAGFYLERWDSNRKEYFRVNQGLLPALLSSTTGGNYSFLDSDVRSKGKIRYRLIEVESDGNLLIHGPVEQVLGKKNGKGKADAKKQKQRHAFAKVAKTPSEKQIKLWKQKKAQRESVRSGHSAKKLLQAGIGKARIYVRDEGLHYVTTSDLAEGLAVEEKVVKKHLRKGKILLSNNNAPVTYLPKDDFSGLYFYAEPLDSNYTLDNVYQCQLVDFATETVMARVTGGVWDSNTADSFPSTVKFEEDVYLVTYAFADPDRDPWFGGFVSTGYYGNTAYTVNLDTPGLAESGMATLRLYLQGATNLTPGKDHYVQVRVNGAMIEGAQWVTPQAWDGQMSHVAEMTLDQSLLQAAGNSIEISGVLTEGVEQSSFLVDSLQLVYQRMYQADDNQLKLAAVSNAMVNVNGFENPDITVIDISDKKRPQIVADYEIASSGAGYDVSFGTGDGVRFLAASLASAQPPVKIEQDLASTLRDSGNGADYLIISPRSLRTGAEALASYRAMQFNTKVVDLQDIYDEFNYGIADVNAIRGFLAHVWNKWTVVPKFVVLAGKGTLDPKDIKGYGTNVFPVKLTATPRGLFASDSVLGDVSGDDGVPEFAIGRIPVLSSDEFLAYVEKLKGFEQAKAGRWSDNVVLLTDNADYAGNYPVAGDGIVMQFPEHMYVTHYSHPAGGNVADTRQMVVDALNAGAGVFNYIGHGSMTRLGHEGFFSSDDASLLTNGVEMPLFIASTCYVGNGTFPGYNSLMESLLWNPEGGAIGVWAPTGMSVNEDAVQLNSEMLKALFEEDLEAGEAARRAGEHYRNEGGAKFMLGIYNYFGDPSLRLN